MDTKQVMTTPSLRNVTDSDWEAVASLLHSANLPLDGAHEHFGNFVVAVRDTEIVGCAGLERYGEVGLLRSVAVTEVLRGTGLGKQLTQQVLDQARSNGVKQVILLTETAPTFFPKFGFQPIPRTEVTAPSLESVEFKSACCESAVVMTVTLNP